MKGRDDIRQDRTCIYVCEAVRILSKVMRCLANEACCELHHISAHLALAKDGHCFNCIVYFICVFVSLIYMLMMRE